MTDSLNNHASLPTDKEDDPNAMGTRPTEPEVIHNEAQTPAIDEDHQPDPAEQGSDIEIVAALESLDRIQGLYASLESAGAINKAVATDIHHQVEGIDLLAPNYFTEKPSRTHYETSLEALVVSAESRLGNVFSDGFRNFTESLSNMSNNLEKAGKRLKDQIALYRKADVNFRSFTINNKKILATLSADGQSASAGELFNQTEALLNYLTGTITQLTKKNELMHKVKENKVTEVSDIFAVMLEVPNANVYGSNNQWENKKPVGKGDLSFESPRLPGGLKLQYLTSASPESRSIGFSMQAYTVKNIGKRTEGSEEVEVPDSHALLSFLDKIADQLITLGKDRRLERSSVWSKGRTDNAGAMKIITLKFKVGEFFNGVGSNRANIFFRESTYCAKAVNEVVNAWMKVLELGTKQQPEASTESHEIEPFDLQLSEVSEGSATVEATPVEAPAAMPEVPAEPTETPPHPEGSGAVEIGFEPPADLQDHEPL